MIEDDAIWYPYSLMKESNQILKVSHAEKTKIYTEDGRVLIDAMASWWSVIHGYNHPQLNKVAKKQIDQVSHVMLGGLKTKATHDCAKHLISFTGNNFNKVFFSDSGSVGCEVALKMALQYHFNKGNKTKRKIMTLKGGYHGDTFATMALCDPDDGMHHVFANQLQAQHFLDLPESKSSISNALAYAKEYIQKHHQEIAGFIVEPIFQGASSMKAYSKTFLNELVKICKKHDILVIFDEIATGFGRLGTRFAYEKIDEKPDILILGKGLTAGYMGMAATLATQKIFDEFLKEEAYPFMHGPTFTGNALACRIALESMRIFESENCLNKVKNIEEIFLEELAPLKENEQVSLRINGGIAVVEQKNKAAWKNAQKIAISEGVWLRPFASFLYSMPPYCINEKEQLILCNTIKKIVKEATN